MKFLDELLEEGGGVGGAIFDGGGQAEVIGTAGEDATATIFADQEELDDDLFSCMDGRESLPPGEAADVEKFGTVEEDIGTADPGNFIADNAAGVDELLFEVQWIGGVIDGVALPGNGAGSKRFWLDGAGPEFDVLLVRSHVIEVAETGGGTADEAASLRLEHAQHTLHDGRVEQHIIIEIVDIWSMTLFEQEVALLGEAFARQVTVQLHVVTMPAQGLNQRSNFDAVEVRKVVVCLIRDDDVEISKRLAEQAG